MEPVSPPPAPTRSGPATQPGAPARTTPAPSGARPGPAPTPPPSERSTVSPEAREPEAPADPSVGRLQQGLASNFAENGHDIDMNRHNEARLNHVGRQINDPRTTGQQRRELLREQAELRARQRTLGPRPGNGDAGTVSRALGRGVDRLEQTFGRVGYIADAQDIRSDDPATRAQGIGSATGRTAGSHFGARLGLSAGAQIGMELGAAGGVAIGGPPGAFLGGLAGAGLGALVGWAAGNYLGGEAGAAVGRQVGRAVGS